MKMELSSAYRRISELAEELEKSAAAYKKLNESIRRQVTSELRQINRNSKIKQENT